MQPSLLDRARLFTGMVSGAAACLRTAAHIWGLDALSESEDAWPVELAVPHPAEVPGCAVHVASLPSADVTCHRSVRVTTPERTAFDCAQRLPRPEGIAIVDQFLRRGVDHDGLLRRATGFRGLWETLAMADRGAASPRESWLRVILVEGGLPRPATQIRVDLPGGRLVHLDLGWPAFMLAVEYDGHEHHTSAADRRRDLGRRAALRTAGWRVITVRRDVIPGRGADLVEQVANALIECGWKPAPDQVTRILGRLRSARRRRW
ncbi:hypothetical protein [Nonomuraea africana]|uniref:AbiEi antitoxin C-terminal domain-containing protein n=1 Tax=Nonomuraea africana TaxID=46171 RepID=A0ABR9KM62_9ACTN|nr:hypothetical protein [Nonomuraea africana]MBE1563101.1 hypothetical protein [Nonomuraea africana]